MWRSSLLARHMNVIVFAVCVGLGAIATAMGYLHTRSTLATLTEIPIQRIRFRAFLAYELPTNAEARGAISSYCSMLELARVERSRWVEKERTFCLLMLASTMDPVKEVSQRDSLVGQALSGCPKDSGKCRVIPLLERIALLYPESPWIVAEIARRKSTASGLR